MGRKQMGPFHFQERKIKMKNSRRRKEKTSKVGLPDAVQYKARWEDSHVDVGYDYVMKVAFSFIREEKIWHPYFARIVEGQIFHTTCAIHKQMEISFKKELCISRLWQGTDLLMLTARESGRETSLTSSKREREKLSERYCVRKADHT